MNTPDDEMEPKEMNNKPGNWLGWTIHMWLKAVLMSGFCIWPGWAAVDIFGANLLSVMMVFWGGMAYQHYVKALSEKADLK